MLSGRPVHLPAHDAAMNQPPNQPPDRPSSAPATTVACAVTTTVLVVQYDDVQPEQEPAVSGDARGFQPGELSVVIAKGYGRSTRPRRTPVTDQTKS